MSNSAQAPVPVKQPVQMQTGKGSTFVFRKRWGHIDWRSLASVDVERISREVDLQALQQNIVNVTFCNIELEDFHNLDPNFLKLFRLAQLIIEYLLHSQQYLTEQSALQEEKLQRALQELTQVQDELHAMTEELKTVKKENRKRRKVIQAYQDMINAGATGLHTCGVCNREFVSAEYLQSHMYRRHPKYLTHEQIDATKRETTVTHEELEKKLMENMTEQLQAAETELRMKMERKEREVLDIQTKQMEEWKKQQRETIEEEMRELQEPILSQLREVQLEKAQLEKRQAELDAITAKKQSHLGHLEDSKELCISESKCQAESAKAEVAHLRQQLDSQVQDMQATLKTHEKNWQKKMKNLLSTYQDQLNDSMVRVDLLEQSMTKPNHRSEEQQVGLYAQVTHPQRNNATQEVPSAPLKSAAARIGRKYPSEDSTSVESINQSESSSNDESKDEADCPDADSPILQQCKFNHQPDVMESIKRETKCIFHDALQQRGITKYTRGLSDVQLDMKLGALKQERQKRIETHYNFLEHRKTLAKEIRDTKASDRVVKNPSIGSDVKEKPITHKMSRYGGGASTSKPPKPISAPVGQSVVPNPGTSGNSLSASSSLSTLSVYSTDGSQAEDVHISRNQKPEPVLPRRNSNNDISSGFPRTSYMDEPFHQLRQPTTTEFSDDDSPWDSEEDKSIEKLAAPQDVTGRVSSTPIKSNSEDQLELTENIDEASSTQPELIKVSSKGSDDIYNKPISRTATSRSALTTVSIDDFMDSDLSDLDIT